ncbi:FAD/NAD(P)-binding oxidoreductase family protein [Theobroma cacao]|uniref:FAD/NAD(P)-binding oxidoreductase family protein n=1 Tax=Theobroma cacao TaxID=3641 RepID=A0A061DFW7_THECC|nr:FAD/NAD(P)-binding oxidoreductase family protein [Theobroma cacao]
MRFISYTIDKILHFFIPFKLFDGSWGDPAYRVTAMVGRNGPLECRSSIIGYDMLTPPDLDREIGLTGRNIIHGAMGFDSLFLMRPVQRTGNRIASFSVFFMRMSACVRCQAFTCAAEVLILRVLRSGVMGASGRNAAQLVQDFNKKWDTKLHFFIIFSRVKIYTI